ncbi:hypothetical protein QTP88_026470 [Uroleucon formosanum]
MDRALVTQDDDRVKLIAYAYDLVVFMAGFDLIEMQGKVRAMLGALQYWPRLRGLIFSASKSQAIPLKGRLLPGFTVLFGMDEIVAVSSVNYLGVELRNFWAHLEMGIMVLLSDPIHSDQVIKKIRFKDPFVII